MMKLDTLHKLYVHELKDLYSAETQLLDALPKMEQAAKDDTLRQAFTDHMKQTRVHLDRLTQLFEGLDFEPAGHKCSGMAGLVKEGEDLIGSDIDERVLDAALIAAAQRVEHYEIAAYGTARSYAEKLGMRDAADLLQETLDEEGHANQLLTRLAERSINFMAMTV